MQLGFGLVVLVFVINWQIDAAGLEGKHKGGRISQIEGASIAPRHVTIGKQVNPFGGAILRKMGTTRKRPIADTGGKTAHHVTPRKA